MNRRGWPSQTVGNTEHIPELDGNMRTLGTMSPWCGFCLNRLPFPSNVPAKVDVFHFDVVGGGTTRSRDGSVLDNTRRRHRGSSSDGIFTSLGLAAKPQEGGAIGG